MLFNSFETDKFQIGDEHLPRIHWNRLLAARLRAQSFHLFFVFNLLNFSFKSVQFLFLYKYIHACFNFFVAPARAPTNGTARKSRNPEFYGCLLIHSVDLCKSISNFVQNEISLFLSIVIIITVFHQHHCVLYINLLSLYSILT